MSAREDGTAVRRTGRRTGDSGTREAILEAARSRFAELGYDAASIRGIAADAGVDPALVHHFYGTKEKLFVAAMRVPIVPSEVLQRVWTADRDHVGEEIVRTILAVWSSPATREQATALFRSAVTNEHAATMVREFITSTILGAVAAVSGSDDAELRASLVASQLVGLGITRIIIGLEPLARATDDELVAAVGPTLQRYLTGDLAR